MLWPSLYTHFYHFELIHDYADHLKKVFSAYSSKGVTKPFKPESFYMYPQSHEGKSFYNTAKKTLFTSKSSIYLLLRLIYLKTLNTSRVQ